MGPGKVQVTKDGNQLDHIPYTFLRVVQNEYH